MQQPSHTYIEPLHPMQRSPDLLLRASAAMWGAARLCQRSIKQRWPKARPRTEGFSGRSSIHADAGFTLLEILVVIAILGLLIGLVAPAALRQLGGARTSVAKQSIERISSILDLYKLDVGSYPSTEQGLAALNTRPSGVAGWGGPYLKGDGQPLDPWNRPYLYRSPASRAGHEFDLCSRGPNNQAGDSGPDLICNP